MPVTISITPIVPKEVFNIDAVRLELLNALRAQGREIQREYKATTKTWKHKPKFEMKISLKRMAPEASVIVWTDDRIYGYVDRGTQPHPIVPKKQRRWTAGTAGGRGGRFRVRAKVLAMPRSSRPKTRPGRLSSGPGARSKDLIFRAKVRRQSIRARKFSENIANKLTRSGSWAKRVKKAVDRGLAKAK